MEIEQLEQIAAVIVTAGLVAGNFLMFTPWRNGKIRGSDNRRAWCHGRKQVKELKTTSRESDATD